MKTIILQLAVLFCIVSANAQTAVNFNCNDCNGVSHDLFTELDNGDVVVICWVMPCGSCVSGSLTCSNIVSTYPSNVKFYLVDDLANTTCTSLNSWASSNNVHPTATFSNAAINMSHYGSTGMPKCIVVGGPNHTVFYNANNSFNSTSIQNAIDQAMIAASVPEKQNTFEKLTVFPNPATSKLTVRFFTNDPSSSVNIELFNMQGQKLESVSYLTTAGENLVDFNLVRIPAGNYLVRITNDKIAQFTNVVVTK